MVRPQALQRGQLADGGGQAAQLLVATDVERAEAGAVAEAGGECGEGVVVQGEMVERLQGGEAGGELGLALD